LASSAVLRLTPSARFQSRSSFLRNAITLENEASFSSFFQFRISNSQGAGDADGRGADGIVFAIQTLSNTAGGLGGGIGFRGIPSSLGIEFYTYNNGVAAGDPNGNHIGIDLNGSVSSVATAPITPILNNGNVYSAWVDYNGITDNLEVRFADTTTRPITPLLSRTVDLISVLGQSSAFVGFTSGTGAGYNNHDILNFAFTNNFEPISVTPIPTPPPLPTNDPINSSSTARLW